MMSKEVKLSISVSSFLAFHFFIGFSQGNFFTINRNRDLNLDAKYIYSWDSFTIPISICHRTDIHFGCGSFDAEFDGGQSCSCLCPRNRTTFVFHDNRWTCLENYKVRNLQDCSKTTLFYTEARNPQGQLWTLKMDNLWFPTNIPYNWYGCEMHLNSSWYLGCNGSRLTSSQYLKRMKDLFGFRVVTVRAGGHTVRRFALQVKSGVQNAHVLQGKIVTLGIQCGSDRHGYEFQGCLMFKLLGQQTCNVSAPSLQTSSPVQSQQITVTGTPVRTPTGQIPLHSMVASLTTTEFQRTKDFIVSSTSMLIASWTTASATQSTTSTTVFDSSTTVAPSWGTPPTTSGIQRTKVSKALAISSTIVGPRSTVSATESTTLTNSFVRTSTITTFAANIRPRPSSGQERSADGASSSLIIAGITVSTVLLVVVIVGLLVYRRRHSNKKPRESTKGKINTQDTLMMSPQTNSAFQCDDGNEYKTFAIKAVEPQIYESAYTLPQCPTANNGPKSEHFYAPLNIQEGQNFYGPQNNQEPFYHVLEKPTVDGEVPLQHHGVNRLEQPVYNIVEELSFKEGLKVPANHGAEPAYNVLEDPELVVAKGPGQYGARSLEGPTYNTLEQPSSDHPYRANCKSERIKEPVYKVLEVDLSSAIDKYNGARDLQDPVHNVNDGEGPEGPKNPVSEPLYYVLEDPNLDCAEGPHSYGAMPSEEPIYNTLEEPITGDPYGASCSPECKDELVYNALEDETYARTSVVDKYGATDFQAPVYSVLEGP